MKSSIQIKLDANGNAIRQSSNPEYGYIILSQERITIKTNGWVDKKTFTTLIRGKIEDLQNSGLTHMKDLPGNIIVIEQTEPFDSFDPNKALKVAGDTGIILCTEDGEPIYRKTIYDGSGLMTDILIPHANGDEIKAANTKKAPKKKISLQKAKKVVTPPAVEMKEVIEDTEKIIEFNDEIIEEDIDTDDITFEL
jgi:hypothetical protein